MDPEDEKRNSYKQMCTHYELHVWADYFYCISAKIISKYNHKEVTNIQEAQVTPLGSVVILIFHVKI